MAGLGAKKFATNSLLSSSDVNGYLADQVIMRFANSAARDAAFGGVGEPTLAEGMTCYLDDTNEIQSYSGSAWVGVAASSTVADVSSGLVYVGGGSLSSTSKDFQGCFTSKYRDYLVTLNGVGTSAANAIWYRMLSGATPASGNYYYSFRGLTSAGASDDVANPNFTYGYAGINTASAGNFQADSRIHFRAPFVATGTRAQIEGAALAAGAYTFRTGQCSHDVNTAYDGFQILTTTAVTFSSGTVSIYGYRT